MGQDMSKERVRIEEIQAVREQTVEQRDKLHEWAKVESAAGIAAAPGSYQALCRDATHTVRQLDKEACEIFQFYDAQREGRSLPMPARTPRFRLPKHAAAALERGTPMPAASMRRGQRGGSGSGSSIEEGGHTGGAEGSVTEPLLAIEPER